MENSIGGSELLDLSQDDMKMLGITKLGHRKKLLRKIGILRGDLALTDSSSQQVSAASSSAADSSEHSERSESNTSAPKKMKAKCKWRGTWYAVTITASTTFKSLKRQLEEQFHSKIRIKYSDIDGDQMSLKREGDFQDAIQDMQSRGLNRIKLYLTPRDNEDHSSSATAATGDAKKSAKPEVVANPEMFSMFELLLDPVVVISETGIIQFANKKVENLFGWTQAEMFGRNVTILMPDDQKAYHDTYLSTYLKTGVSRIIGIGRDVIALKKDGSFMPIHLEVTEKSMGTGKLFFIGIMKEAKTQIQEKSLIQQEREVLYSLTVPAVIIDSTGLVHGFNKAAQDMLGFSLVEVIGKNVNILIPSPHREAHDQYIQNYLETGKSQIIGVGRNVVAQHKDGHLIPVFLSITEKRDKEKRFFTGIIQEVHAIVPVVNSKSAAAAIPK
jgi:PAS domain S-box-containing protein